MAECFNCGGTLTAHSLVGDTVDQFNEALPVYLDGGYGMFYDWPLTEEMEEVRDGGTNMLKVILCHDCGHKLCEALPAIGRLLDGGHMRSNAERDGYECPWDT